MPEVNRWMGGTAQSSVRIAICGLGLDTYWPQFAGLRDRLCGAVDQVAGWIAEEGFAVTNLGMVDSYETASAAASRCRREEVDALFLFVTTYALSATVLTLVRRAGVPVVVLNLQPDAAMDYEAVNAMGDRTAMTGEWLAWCSACPMPEIANLFARAGWTFRQVNGALTDISTRKEVAEWIRAMRVQAILARSRTGLMGHYYSGMLDIATDVTRLATVLGVHPEFLEVDELSALANCAVMCRGLCVPPLNKLARAEGKSITAICVADLKNRSSNAFTFGHNQFVAMRLIFRNREKRDRPISNGHLHRKTAAYLAVIHAQRPHAHWPCGNRHVPWTIVSHQHNVVTHVHRVVLSKRSACAKEIQNLHSDYIFDLILAGDRNVLRCQQAGAQDDGAHCLLIGCIAAALVVIRQGIEPMLRDKVIQRY